MVEILPIETPSLGDRSYLVHDGRTALVIDPQRDIDRVLEIADRIGLTISHVFETHMHNDYVFTGGSLLYGSTGRPDLVGPEHTGALVRAQYRSAHRIAAQLPDATPVYPTHGFGSFCSATTAEGTCSTVGAEKSSNPVLTQDEERFVADLLAGLDAFPAYYGYMGPANLNAPETEPDLSLPTLADPAELRRRIEPGEWVVDLRDRTAFAAGHLAGTINAGLDGQFATYLGWVMPWGAPLTLLGQSAEQVVDARRELTRIGIDRASAAATGGPQAWSGGARLEATDVASFADLARVRAERDIAVLDVRRNLEWSASHIAGAVHIPLHELPGRLAEVPGGELWVHCAGGYRASLAASILAAQGRRVVAVDDEFGNAAAAGLDLQQADEVAA